MKKRNLVLFGTTAMLSLALAGTIGAVTASAAQSITNTETGDKTVELSYTVAEKWTVTIPDSLDISSGSANDTVTASDVVLSEGKSLKVTVKSAHEWKLQTEGGKTIDYTLMIGEADASSNDGVIFEGLNGESTELEKELSVEVTGDAKYAGTYTDTLTFNVSVEGGD